VVSGVTPSVLQDTVASPQIDTLQNIDTCLAWRLNDHLERSSEGSQ
jgi:hypothetical protein